AFAASTLEASLPGSPGFPAVFVVPTLDASFAASFAASTFAGAGTRLGEGAGDSTFAFGFAASAGLVSTGAGALSGFAGSTGAAAVVSGADGFLVATRMPRITTRTV